MKKLCCHFLPRSCDSAYHGSLCLRVAVHSGQQQAVLCALGEISCGRQFNRDWRLCRSAIAWYIKNKRSNLFFIISWAFNFCCVVTLCKRTEGQPVAETAQVRNLLMYFQLRTFWPTETRAGLLLLQDGTAVLRSEQLLHVCVRVRVRPSLFTWCASVLK